MNKNLKTFGTIGVVALCLWLGSSYASNYLADGHIRAAKLEREQKSPPVEIPVEIENLRKQVESNPTDLDSRLTLARAYHKEASRREDGQLLLSAVQQYSEVLQEDANNAPALYELAMLTMDQGLLEKSIEYFGRYLVLYPNDLRAQTNLSLAKVQNNQAAEAIPVLKEVVEKAPTLFPPRFALALAYQVSKQKADALRLANEALELAPNEDAIAKVKGFIAAISNSEEKNTNSTPLKQAVDSYFKNHSIIGPKLKEIKWQGQDAVSVMLSDFPVDQMPPVARKSFEAKIKAQFASYETPLLITLRDAASNSELLKISTK